MTSHTHRARLLIPAALAVTTLALTVTPALAAAVTGSGKTEATFILQVILLLTVGRLLGEGLQRLGQPAIMGQLLAGIVLGPSVFGFLLPDLQKAVFPSAPEQQAMINAVSQLGILMLLLLTGMETDLALVRKVRGAAAAISITGIALPFACGFALGQYLPDSILPMHMGRLIPSLFLGTALSISSVKIVASIVREMNFMRRDVGQVIVSSAIIEDTIGWVIIAITFGIAGHGSLDWFSLAKDIAGIAVFMVFSFTIGRRIVFALIRWTNDNFRSEFPVITMILIIMGGMAEITQLLGVHTVLGAFVAGILVGESPILTRHVEDQLRGLITALFMPVFFGLAGLTADLTVLSNLNLLLLTAALVAIASVGKFTGAFLGGELGGLNFRQSVAVGSAMNARGSTEVIVASIGLAMGALTQNLYTMIVTMAVLTTLAMPPMLRRALMTLPMGKEEQTRVEREALDTKGFVPNLERLLLSVDDSGAGKLVSRIAGLIAGAYGMPITIVRMKAHADDTEEPPDGASRQVKEGAKTSQKVMQDDAAEPDPEKVHITSRVATEEPAAAIVEESRKGFDLMMIGLETTHDKDGVFNDQTTRIAKEFDGSVALLAAPGDTLPPLDSRLRLIVPVNGTSASRHAAEIACVIARPTGARVQALFVSAGTDRFRGGGRATRAQEEAVLKDIADLGERYNVNLTTSLQPRTNAETAIVRAANEQTLIVMGVSARPGEQLFFGATASAVLTKSKAPILFVATATI